MKKTVTLHMGGGKAYRTHNGRYYKGNAPAHVAQARRCENEILADMSHRRAYDLVFGKAVEEYNERQKRADRKIKSYYDEVRRDKSRHTVYELILQVGDRNTTGVENCETERAILREYAKTFEERNPQMYVVGAYIHGDEVGTIHLHLDVIPWADGYKRGPSRQCSISRCCEQMGYAKGAKINETAQAAWTAAERAVLEEITRAHGIEVEHVRSGRLHEADKEVFIAEQKARDAAKEVASIRDEQMGLILDTYRLRAEAEGRGYEYISSAEVEALRAEAAKSVEAQSERDDLFDIIRSDKELEARFRVAMEKWAEAEPPELEEDKDGMEL